MPPVAQFIFVGERDQRLSGNGELAISRNWNSSRSVEIRGAALPLMLTNYLNGGTAAPVK